MDHRRSKSKAHIAIHLAHDLAHSLLLVLDLALGGNNHICCASQLFLQALVLVLKILNLFLKASILVLE